MRTLDKAGSKLLFHFADIQRQRVLQREFWKSLFVRPYIRKYCHEVEMSGSEYEGKKVSLRKLKMGKIK